MFFPDASDHVSIRAAKNVCLTCPVRLACLQWALDTNQQFGIWGWLTEDERRRVSRGASLPQPTERPYLTLPPGSRAQHGTYTTYSRGCRCEPCTVAVCERQRRKRADYADRKQAAS